MLLRHIYARFKNYQSVKSIVNHAEISSFKFAYVSENTHSAPPRPPFFT